MQILGFTSTIRYLHEWGVQKLGNLDHASWLGEFNILAALSVASDFFK